MSCCPSSPAIKVGSGFPDEPTVANPPARVPGESEDCYQKRVGSQSTTGEVGDKPEPAPDMIKQNAIAPKATPTECTVDLTFTVSGPKVAAAWTFERKVAGVDVASFNGETGTAPNLKVTFAAADYGKKMSIRVKAFEDAGMTQQIDDRTYAFSPALGTPTNSLKLIHPLPGAVVTSKFGPRKPPVSGASSEHGGVDFASRKPGTKVLCGADGTVTLCRPGSGYGNYVMVKHENGSGKHLVTSLYAHLDSFLVKLGDKVLAGQPVGIEGNTGHGSGKHLHFEVRLPNGAKVDPLPYIDGNLQVAESNSPTVTTEDAADRQQGTVTPEDVAARSDC